MPSTPCPCSTAAALWCMTIRQPMRPLTAILTDSQRHTYSALLVLTLTSSALYDTEAPYNVSLQSLAGYLAVEDSYGLENATVSAGAASGIAASEDLVLQRLGGSSAEVGLLLTSSSQDFSPVTISIAGRSGIVLDAVFLPHAVWSLHCQTLCLIQDKSQGSMISPHCLDGIAEGHRPP